MKKLKNYSNVCHRAALLCSNDKELQDYFITQRNRFKQTNHVTQLTARELVALHGNNRGNANG